LVLVLSGAFCYVARATLKTVKFLGSGSEKNCFLLNDGRVGLFERDGSEKYLKKEHLALKRLAKVGVPTFQVELLEVELESRRRELALVGRRYDHHALSGDTDEELYVGDFETRFSKILAIAQKLRDAKMEVSDPQFLFDAEGDIVLCDPGRVRKMSSRHVCSQGCASGCRVAWCWQAIEGWVKKLRRLAPTKGKG